MKKITVLIALIIAIFTTSCQSTLRMANASVAVNKTTTLPSGNDEECPECNPQAVQNKIDEIQQQFNITINNKNGLWTLDYLTAVQNGMQKLQDAMGPDEFAHQFTGVSFVARNKGNGMTTNGKQIFAPVGLPIDYIEKSTIHELAHVWDFNCKQCESTGMMKATHGSDKNGYKPGCVTPTSYAASLKIEDWAETVTSYVYPGYAENNNWTERQDYIETVLANNK
jgi:hypothetical protein